MRSYEKEIKHKVTVYEAVDNKTFLDKSECIEHERVIGKTQIWIVATRSNSAKLILGNMYFYSSEDKAKAQRNYLEIQGFNVDIRRSTLDTSNGLKRF